MSNAPWLKKAADLYDESGFRDGDILSHDWIRWALDVPEPRSLEHVTENQFLLMSRFEAFREWLLIERKTALQSVRGKGYWIVPPDEHARVAVDEAMKDVAKGLRRGGKMLSHARTEMMSSDARKRHTDAEVRMSGIRSLMSRQRRDVFLLFKKSAD